MSVRSDGGPGVTAGAPDRKTVSQLKPRNGVRFVADDSDSSSMGIRLHHPSLS